MTTFIDRLKYLFTGKSNPSPLYNLHPELEHRVPIARWTADDLEGQPSSPTYRTHLQFYGTQVWFHKAVKVIKDNLAALPVQVMQGRGADEVAIDGHPIAELLANPNETMSGSDLWGEWVTDLYMAGEHGQEVVRNGRGDRSLELWPRQPDQIWVRVEDYRYRRVRNYKIDDGSADPYELEPTEFIFSKFYNPFQIFRGLSPINAVRRGIVIDQLAQAWSELFFKNNARPDFAVIAPEGVTGTEKDEIYVALDERFRGGNQHRPIVLEQGITDIKTFSFPPKDMEWIEQRKLSRDEIGAIVGVPDEIMGYGRDTYENFDTADRVLWTLTIVPLTRFRDQVYTRFFRKTGELDRDQRLQTDLSDVSQLQEDRAEQVSQYQTLVQNYWPPNRAIEYLGMQTDELPGGDAVYVPFGVGPLNGDSNQVTQQNLGYVWPHNKAWQIPAFGTQGHEALWKQHQARIEDPLKAMQRQLKRYFQEQQNDIARKLRNNRTYGRGKWTGKQDEVPPPGELFDRQAWIDRFAEMFGGLITDTVATIGLSEIQSLVNNVLFEIDNELVQRGITFIIQDVAGKVNDTTFSGLLQLLGEAEVAGEGIPAIQERLSVYFGDRKSDWQTERIARTTMTGAANFASEEAWDQSGVVQDKTWISALLPDRTRDDHAAAHGQTVSLRGQFIVGGEQLAHPGDPGGSPGNIINCLCTMIAQVED